MTANSIIKRVLGAEPLGEGGSRNEIEARGKAFPPIILGLLSLVLAFISLADVECNWANGTYVCSGVGDSVIVHSGGDNTGGNEPVYTNGLGVCTNCSQIAPSELAQLANELRQQSETIKTAAQNLQYEADKIFDTCMSNKQVISGFQYHPNTTEGMTTFTNYFCTTENDPNPQIAAVKYATQGSCFLLSFIPEMRNTALIGNNSVYFYANNSVVPALDDIQTKTTHLYQELGYIRDACHSIGSAQDRSNDYEPTIATRMEEGAVACQVSMNTNNPSGGGTTTGDWCTYDQGEALKEALRELNKYANAISNKLDQYETYLKGIKDTIKEGLFTPYNKIPESLGDDWRDLYNSPETSTFGYANTNILARIELLLYGLTKPYTNDTPFSEDAEITGSPEDMEDKGEQWKQAVNGIRSDANDREVQSLGSALTDFIRAISYTGREATEGQELIPEITYEMEGQYYAVPAFKLTNASFVNDFQQLTRAFVTASCALALAILTFMYWRWFAEKCIKFTRWGTEIITSMFAS